MNRRDFLRSSLAAPAIIMTSGLLMPVRSFGGEPQELSYLRYKFWIHEHHDDRVRPSHFPKNKYMSLKDVSAGLLSEYNDQPIDWNAHHTVTVREPKA